mgnify:FL=1
MRRVGRQESLHRIAVRQMITNNNNTKKQLLTIVTQFDRHRLDAVAAVVVSDEPDFVDDGRLCALVRFEAERARH